jgi:hypothetical protein
MAKTLKSCTCPGSIYGGFKMGAGAALGVMLVAGVPLLLLTAFALPAYLGSLTRAAAATTPTIKGLPYIDANLMPN